MLVSILLLLILSSYVFIYFKYKKTIEKKVEIERVQIINNYELGKTYYYIKNNNIIPFIVRNIVVLANNRVFLTTNANILESLLDFSKILMENGDDNFNYVQKRFNEMVSKGAKGEDHVFIHEDEVFSTKEDAENKIEELIQQEVNFHLEKANSIINKKIK